MNHRYVTDLRATSTTGSLAVHNFRANGMFDPDQSGTGHQPLYFDQLTAIYNHFTVIGSKISVTFTTDANTSFSTIVGIAKNDDPTVTPATSANLCELSDTVHAVLRGSLYGQKQLTQSFSAKGTFGGSVLANDDLQGSASADPLEQTFYTIFVQNPLLESSTVEVHIVIEYTAVWDELKDLASS